MKKRKLDRYKEDYSKSTEYENNSISISFKDTCEKNCLLEQWNAAGDLKQLNKCLKIISSLTWTSLPSYNGLYFKRVPYVSLTKPLPEQISKDEAIFELRIGCDSARRLFGYRNKNVFHIIWFDLNHSVIPYSKIVR